MFPLAHTVVYLVHLVVVLFSPCFYTSVDLFVLAPFVDAISNSALSLSKSGPFPSGHTDPYVSSP